MNIDISPKAYEDIEEIKNYISNNLKNPSAGLKIAIDILNAIKNLKDFPNIGAPLNTILSVRSSYRFIPCHNHIIFYRIDEERIFISRVLYKHRQFVDLLFK